MCCEGDAEETPRSRGCARPNEDPLDVVNVLENTSDDERGAVGIATLERGEAPAASTFDRRKDRNAVTPDPHDDRVVDSCRNPVRRVNHQEASSASTTSAGV